MKLIQIVVCISLLIPLTSHSPIEIEEPQEGFTILSAEVMKIAQATIEQPTSTPPLYEERKEYYDLIYKYAEEYGVDPAVMIKVIQCESGFNPTIQSSSRYPDGRREQSYGLVQIHLPAHPTVSYEQAIDPDFAIRFMAQNMAKGKYSMWTCWRSLYTP